MTTKRHFRTISHPDALELPDCPDHTEQKQKQREQQEKRGNKNNKRGRTLCVAKRAPPFVSLFGRKPFKNHQKRSGDCFWMVFRHFWEAPEGFLRVFWRLWENCQKGFFDGFWSNLDDLVSGG